MSDQQSFCLDMAGYNGLFVQYETITFCRIGQNFANCFASPSKYSSLGERKPIRANKMVDTK